MPPAKRQMDLGSFFAAAPAIKKARASSPIASSSSASPFSRATYTASLSKVAKTSFKQSEAELLALECETMEENWLEMLQTEIRKPYFLSLKSFLWAEGVQGAEVQSSKVYPAGTFHTRRVWKVADGSRSPGHLRVE
jgi:uracil-DNA glycosylase